MNLEAWPLPKRWTWLRVCQEVKNAEEEEHLEEAKAENDAGQAGHNGRKGRS